MVLGRGGDGRLAVLFNRSAPRGRLPPARPRRPPLAGRARRPASTVGPRAVAFVAERPAVPADGAARCPLSPAGPRAVDRRRTPTPDRQGDTRWTAARCCSAALAGLLGARLPAARRGRPLGAGRARRALQLRHAWSPARAGRRPSAYRRPLMKLTRALRRPELRPVPRHPLPRGQAAVHRRQPRLPDGPDAAGLLLPGQDRGQPRRRGGVAEPRRLLHRLLRLPPGLFPLPRRPRARPASPRTWASAACASAIRSTGPGSGTRSRCSRARATSAPWRTAPLRPLGPRPRHRHRRPGPRGVPDLHRLLGAGAAARRHARCGCSALLDSNSVAGAFDFAHRRPGPRR